VHLKFPTGTIIAIKSRSFEIQSEESSGVAEGVQGGWEKKY
jgi:hypothetical protein